jgi:TRAP-type C4-dicarboxylate transport system permease large subunit
LFCLDIQCFVLALLIPPSLNMILYAWVGGTSILASFAATVIPELFGNFV